MRILLCIGTRPEAIKMLPLVKEMQRHGEISCTVCFSNQHSKMANDVFEYFGIKPDFRFYSTQNNRTLKEMTREFLHYFDVIIERENPDLVLVHGDTVTAFCACLAAFYRGVEIGHIEAGLRTHDVREPFPEEFFRVAVDSMSSYHFCPTHRDAENLEKEGKRSVFVVGNTVIDALKYTLDDGYSSPILDGANGRKIVLLTSHRRENLGEKMESAFLGISDVLRARDDLYCIYPVHPNPRIRRVAHRVFSGVENIRLCEPLPLYDFHNVLSRSFAVLTDSGGIQEEGAYLGIPIFLLRENTERQGCILSGNVRVIGTSRDNVRDEFLSTIEDVSSRALMQKPARIFGEGDACEKIIKILLPFS